MRQRTSSWPVLLLLTALLTGCGSSRVASLPLQASQPPVPQQEGYVDAGGGVRLFYRVLGAAAPDTIVVLHGGPGYSSAYIADDLAPLAARYTLVFYDQRGAGRSTLVSDSAALTGERFAEELEAVRRHFGLGRVTLLGHSWGAGVAADVFPPESARAWAAALPNARMLLLDGVGHFPYLEAPDRFGAAVDAFMAGAWPPGAIAAVAGS